MFNKRGQVTIFIIIALAVIGIAILIYFLFPKIRGGGGFDVNDPHDIFDNCINDFINEKADLIASQGGSLEPQNYFLFRGERVEYLCYTNQYYASCVVQRPLLQQHFERELKNSISEQSNKCFEDLKEGFQKKGYDVYIENGDMKLELLPKIISLNFDRELTLTRGEESKRFEDFNIAVNNNVYELTSIANSIVDWETTYGDAEVTVYMNYYRDLKVEKWKQSDGTTVYILTDRNNGKIFRFASRSLAWPPGYGG